MPGKGKCKQKKKQPSLGQTSKAAKTVKQPEENECDSDIDNTDEVEVEVDVEADDDTVGTEYQENVTVKSKVQEDKQSSLKDSEDMPDKSKMDNHMVEENGAVGSSPSEKKLTRKEMKKMKKKACK